MTHVLRTCQLYSLMFINEGFVQTRPTCIDVSRNGDKSRKLNKKWAQLKCQYVYTSGQSVKQEKRVGKTVKWGERW